ncbi:MAG: flippase-like domain-containing protein [Flavobacteriales bacterium]|nr:flippase-like domain-containing protein [Flavobacteriales bacterium]MBK7556356.1 flippase-like domain-containing protein [Flavobacteriales bacterium]
MKKAVIGFLKLAIPIALGIWLVVYFYSALDEKQREQLFTAFRQADLKWLFASVLLGWLSHVSRGWRWRYVLEPMGYAPGFWNCYHAVMNGYFMNMLVQRAGEASRAVSLYRSEGVPFEKGFGSILAERVIDMVMLLIIAGVTLLLQVEKLDLLQTRIAAFRAGQGTKAASGTPWWVWAVIVVVICVAIGVWLLLTRPLLRTRLKDTVRGFMDGMRSVLRMRRTAAFVLHTFLIWGLYIGMFWVGFFALPTTAEVPAAGVFAGFIAGSIGIALVQGGIGVYPAFVALIVSAYMPGVDSADLLQPDALAMGWLLWVAQTLMIIVLGGLSLLLSAAAKRRATS